MQTPSGNQFFESVWEVVRLIPQGRVTTYGAIAVFLGTKGSARMVGYAMNASHHCTPPVPAHRVVNRKGLLTGRHHFAEPTRMEELLTAEGIVVKNHQVLEFDRLFWSPESLLQSETPDS